MLNVAPSQNQLGYHSPNCAFLFGSTPLNFSLCIDEEADVLIP